MLRNLLLATNYAKEPGFRWRGADVSRLEGLSDAVFAFAITLLVVSLEVPKSTREVVALMRGFIPFGFTFFILYRLWATQYRFFRRYGLEDGTTRTLNGALLFFVLFYIYPLKFLASSVADWFVSQGARSFHPGVLTATLHNADVRVLITTYFLGSAAVFTTLGLMYLHAWRHRVTLDLTPAEELTTRHTVERLLSGAALTVLTPVALLLYGSGDTVISLALDGVVYVGVGLMVWRTRMAAKRRKELMREA